MGASILFWRRTDVAGLERLQLVSEPDGVLAVSTVLCLEDGGFRLDHRWRLDADWRPVRDHRTLERARAWTLEAGARWDWLAGGRCATTGP